MEGSQGGLSHIFTARWAPHTTAPCPTVQRHPHTSVKSAVPHTIAHTCFLKASTSKVVGSECSILRLVSEMM